MRKRGTTSDDEKDLALYSDGYDGSLNATIPQQYVFIEEEDESSISRQTNGILPPPPIRKSSSLSVPGRLKRRVKGGKQRKNDGSTRNHKSSTLFRWHKLFHRVQMSQYSCLCLAVLLWYSLGVISISTSKLLLTPSKHHIRSPRYYYHAGGVAPLILTLQQLFLGSNFLRFLLNIRFMNSAGLQPYASLGSADSLLSSSSPRERRRLSKQKDDWNTIINLLQNEHSRYLVYAGICFTVGFWATNVGFHGTSASFVETIKAAEPITSATLAVSRKLESLSQMEIASLLSIVAGVVLSTLGHTAPSSAPSSSSETPVESFLSCAIVMGSNLCFSFRGLYQKLFRAKHSAQVIDDLNLQFRMQQIGVWVLFVPAILWDGPSIARHVYQVSARIGLFKSGILLRYICLSVVNGLAFTCYNLASTYILSRISVVHHAALNCIRRIFAIIVTSIIFSVPVTPVGALGILISFFGFLGFTYYKTKKAKLPKPISSLLPLNAIDADANRP